MVRWQLRLRDFGKGEQPYHEQRADGWYQDEAGRDYVFYDLRRDGSRQEVARLPMRALFDPPARVGD